VPASHTTYAPFIKKLEYQCIDIDEDNFITCMDADGNTRSDLKTPDQIMPNPPQAVELTKKIKDFLEEETDFYIIVTSACGHEQVMDTKLMTAGAN